MGALLNMLLLLSILLGLSILRFSWGFVEYLCVCSLQDGGLEIIAGPFAVLRVTLASLWLPWDARGSGTLDLQGESFL